jgi:serine/threonine protein kinase
MSAPLPSQSSQLIDARDRFMAALQGNSSPVMEDFLKECATVDHPALLRMLIEVEIEHFGRSGETLPISGYRQRFPEHRAVIDRLVGGSDVVRRMVDRLGELGILPPAEQVALQSELSSSETIYSAETLCQRLVRQRYITPFQAQILKHGETDRLLLGEYVLLDKIGQGGMGIVYRAKQPALNRVVALKTIRSHGTAGSEEIRRFRLEAESAARLSHPGIVPVYDFGEAEGIQFFAMELIEGTSLTARIAQSALGAQQAAELLRQLAEAVAYAHTQGVIHRDLKPSNILLDQRGRPWITDFGLAKMIDAEGLTTTGEVLGTPSYMPPEQAIGTAHEVREGADVYALGAVLYACLTGHPPFQSDSVMATLKMVIEQLPVPPRQVNQVIPRDLETICLKCLEKSPARRYATASALAQELQRFLNGEPILARPLGLPQQFWRWCLRNPVVATLSATAVALLVAGTATSTYFAVLASQRAARAEEGTKIAVETLESVIFTVQDKLREIPQARQARKEILAMTLKEMEKLSDDERASRRVEIGTAAVLVRFAVMIMDVGSDEALGTLATAERNLARACEIYAATQAAEPENARLESEWAFALMKAGDLAVIRNQPEQAAEHIQLAIAKYRHVCSADQASPACRRLLSESLCIWGDVLDLRNDLDGALHAYREAKELAIELRKLDARNTDFLDLQIMSLEKEADVAMRRNEFISAQALFQESLALNEEYVAAAPTDPVRMMSLSVCLERLGDVTDQLKAPEQAIDYYRRELDIMLRAIAADPENPKYREELEFPVRKLTGLYRRLKRPQEIEDLKRRVQQSLSEK